MKLEKKSTTLFMTLHQGPNHMLLISTTGILFRKDVSVLFLLISKEFAIYLYLIQYILEYSKISSMSSLLNQEEMNNSSLIKCLCASMAKSLESQRYLIQKSFIFLSL
jgi:hypothetical protein